MLAVSELPAADYYVVEEMLPLLPKDPYIKNKVSLIKLRSFLLAHLYSGSGALRGYKLLLTNFIISFRVDSVILNLSTGMKLKRKFLQVYLKTAKSLNIKIRDRYRYR
jgi:hypothetical protein